MLKELLSLFRSSDAIAKMGEDFSKMLGVARELTVQAGEAFFGEHSGEEERQEISKRDIAINQLERSIRKQVIAHLTLSSDAHDVPYCLLLMSIVKDVERIGDYAKNLVELRPEGGGPVPDDEHGDELREIRRIVENSFAEVNHVFATSDARAASALINEGRAVNRRCDAMIGKVTRSGYDAATATSLVLGARYYKRIGSHLLNVLSGVVMPLHKLDYYDEDALAVVEDPGDE
jgi:phosphate uptake regulator